MRTVEGIQAVSAREPFVFIGGIAEDRHIRVAVGEGALVPVTPRPCCSLCLGGIELHPDGEFFFTKNFGSDLQEALQTVAEERLPELADEGKLVAKGVG